ncbi:uncharacterized protein N7483_005146 [Penicillium malachiteum]|uniref:uncharacterized protein n=1 Tax=Penicillium malachiteum TaxID=1324776 RepID=UPI00254792CC|nr:uncharacterized protein N7483_005146 [Penicillium malachiteum]KAJ5730638.1 hypothetical protein N7483_005146 [Penicillium malachiteum]
MSSVSAHLMRRGVELASTHFQEPKKPEDEQTPGGLVALFALSFIIFVLILGSIEYTYGLVVGTLAAVEDSNPDIYVRIDGNNDPTKPFDPNDPEPAAAPTPKPITSKLRTTIKHLRSRAGFWSRFRGLSMFLAWNMARGFISAIIPISSSSFLSQFFLQSIVTVFLCTWQMAWVHIVITEPSPKRFYQRIPSWRSWIKIVPAAILQDVLAAAAFFLPMAIAKLTGAFNITPGADNSMKDIFRSLAFGAIPALLALIITIPARVVFIRVAASMLPEEEETIVPFDRSFGGKVQPAIVGGSGKIGLLEAWTTFDWASRVRLYKVIGKTFAMHVAVLVVGGLVLGAQLFIMMPKNSGQNNGSAGTPAVE